MVRKPWLWGMGSFSLLLGIASGVWYWNFAGPPGSDSQRPGALATVARLESPSPPASDYVGSAACAECHSDIAASYASHPMANSCAAIDQATPLEDYSAADFTAADGRRYYVEWADGRVLHHESLADGQGALYDVAVEMAYVLGSGRHGRAYLAQRDGLLFQSPITWYAQQTRWDLSPGYDPHGHQGFERRVGDGCLYCHVGRVAPGTGGMDIYDQPAFVEATIGCERCHGPGGRHVAFHRQTAAEPDAADPIIHPAKLPPAERDAVCFICHLQGRATFRRFGRGFFDFRPGQSLQDTLLIYLEGARVDQQQTTLPVSQVEQMQISKCYRESQGAFTCTSCHDPHYAPTPAERRAHYRDKCLTCHGTDDCTAPTEQRLAADLQDSCIACHMPALPTREVAHTALTDHRVVRRIQDQPAPAAVADPRQLRLFGDESRIAERERNRGRGLLLMEAAQGLRNARFAEQAQALLTPPELAGAAWRDVLKALDNDPIALDALGLARHVSGAEVEAREAWQAAVRADPRMERSLYSLAESHARAGDHAAALQWLEQLAALNPFTAEVPALREYEQAMSVAVNAEYARMGAPVGDGDEVAFLPPVSGG